MVARDVSAGDSAHVAPFFGDGRRVFRRSGVPGRRTLLDRSRVGQSSLFYVLTNNGLPEALVAPKGAPTLGLQLHQWLTALPLLARPAAESMLVIGFGSGGAVEIIPRSPSEEVDVIELEPLVIEANRRCAELRRFDPLANERINVVMNDARGALSLTDRQYDIVVSQPSHPWTAGASHLYTREFMELVRDHLTEEGVFLQWMNTSFVDDELFKTLGSTLLERLSQRPAVSAPAARDVLSRLGR